MHRLFAPLLLLAVLMPSIAFAQPAAVTSLTARDGEDVAFRWTAVSGATWYYLWVQDSAGIKYLRWYPDHELNCAPSQSTTCRTGVVLDTPTGDVTWWIQTWSSAGYGTWSSAQTFRPGPLFAVVASTGGLSRGTATSAARLGVGQYEVIFARDITSCAFVGNIGGTGYDSAVGSISTTRRSSTASGVYVETRNPAGTLTDLPFHLSISCR